MKDIIDSVDEIWISLECCLARLLNRFWWVYNLSLWLSHGALLELSLSVSRWASYCGTQLDCMIGEGVSFTHQDPIPCWPCWANAGIFCSPQLPSKWPNSYILCIHSTVQVSCITVQASCVTLQATYITVQASYITVQASYITVQASCITVQASCITVKASCVTVQASCVTVRSSCVTVLSSWGTVLAS